MVSRSGVERVSAANSPWKFFAMFTLGMLVPVYFGTRLGVSLAAPKGVSKRMGIKMASRLSFGF